MSKQTKGAWGLSDPRPRIVFWNGIPFNRVEDVRPTIKSIIRSFLIPDTNQKESGKED